jgi:hypothetical protein
MENLMKPEAAYPLELLPADKQEDIAWWVQQPEPPPKWLRAGLALVVSRAWWEWHWARGKRLGERKPSVNRPKIPHALRADVYERDGYRCLHCGTPDALTLDHIHPFSLGGPDTFENLQTLCRRCNSKKGARV